MTPFVSVKRRRTVYPGDVSCSVRRTSDHSSWKRKRRREPCALWRVGASRAGASRAWRSRPRISRSALATSRLGAAPRRETFGRVSKESLGKLNLWNPSDALSEPSSIWNINFDSAHRRGRGAAATRFIPGARHNWHISVDYQCDRGIRLLCRWSRMYHFDEFNFPCYAYKRKCTLR